MSLTWGKDVTVAMDSRQKRDLDNYITGHYGEDQFKHATVRGTCNAEKCYYIGNLCPHCTKCEQHCTCEE